jgi:hypothetical protein
MGRRQSLVKRKKRAQGEGGRERRKLDSILDRRIAEERE